MAGIFDDVVDFAKKSGPGMALRGIPGIGPAAGAAADIYSNYRDNMPKAPEVVQQQAAGARRSNQPRSDPVLQFIRSQSPGMSRKEAKKIFQQFQVQQAAPGLSEFVQSQTNRPNPNVMQMFYNETVAPYLKETASKYQQGAEAGTAAMQGILSGAAPSPAIDVLKSFLPLQAAGDKKMGAALEAATVTAPYYDQLLTQLQENIAQQQRTQFYNQQLAAGGASQQSDPASFGNELKAAATAKVK